MMSDEQLNKAVEEMIMLATECETECADVIDDPVNYIDPDEYDPDDDFDDEEFDDDEDDDFDDDDEWEDF